MHNPRFLFNTMTHFYIFYLWKEILNVFVIKINCSKSQFSSVFVQPAQQLPTTHFCFSGFYLIFTTDLIDLVTHMHTSSCPADIIPPKLIKEVLPVISTWLLSIINNSLLSGCNPDYVNPASVFPLLKKTFIDSTNLQIYSPISKLPCFSKMFVKVEAHQLLQLVQGNNIHFIDSTETALLKMNHILICTSHTKYLR